MQHSDASRPGRPGGSSVAAATWALFVGLGLVMIGNGLNGSELGVRSEAEGFSTGVTGVIIAAYFAGFLAGTRYAEATLRKVGHIRVFAALASTASGVVLLQAILVNPFAWMATRFVFGACMAGIYVVVESWLNDLATNKTRGRILSVYMIVSMGGIAIGQLLLNLRDDTGYRLFVVASVLVSLALVPISLSASSAPPMAIPQSIGLRLLIPRIPIGLMSSFFSGAGAGALIGMAAVYGTRVGITPGRLSIFLAAPLVGALMFQWPIGWLSDKLPRRAVLLGVAVACCLTPLLALAVGERSNLAVAAMFLMGGMMYPFYSLTVAYSNDRLAPEEILGASGTLVRTNGAGAITGPLIAAGLMSAFGARMFYWTLVGIFAVASVAIVIRILTIDPLPRSRQRHWVPLLARGLVVPADLVPAAAGDTAAADDGAAAAAGTQASATSTLVSE